MAFDERFKAKTRVRAYVDSDDFKLVCHDLLQDRLTEWSDRKGTVHDGLSSLLPEFEARKIALTVLDYIRQWETVNFRKRQEARTITFPTEHARESAA